MSIRAGVDRQGLVDGRPIATLVTQVAREHHRLAAWGAQAIVRHRPDVRVLRHAPGEGLIPIPPRRDEVGQAVQTAREAGVGEGRFKGAVDEQVGPQAGGDWHVTPEPKLEHGIGIRVVVDPRGPEVDVGDRPGLGAEEVVSQDLGLQGAHIEAVGREVRRLGELDPARRQWIRAGGDLERHIQRPAEVGIAHGGPGVGAAGRPECPDGSVGVGVGRGLPAEPRVVGAID